MVNPVRIIATLGCIFVPLFLLVPVSAQILADKSAPANQQPGVLKTANDTLLIDIQTPSQQGVSRNTYRQFDIPAAGVILNNARTPVLTQLGGWVPGNAFLPGRTARVILNEVNAPEPSILLGYIEVAGDRAQVIVANAAGITCNGCGFINAAGATLTTGVPVLKSGNLESFRVQRGALHITGSGLDASTADYTDLIARAVEVNAGLWARQLSVTAGANAPTLNPPPRFVMDVSQLGGLYAGKIFLIGTEAGVGMRNAGHIGASAGDVIVTTQGQLENRGRITSTGSTAITAITASQGITNSGLVYAQTSTSLKSPGHIDNADGILVAGQHLRIDSESLSGNGQLLSQGDIDIRLAEDYTHQGVLQADGNAKLAIAGVFTNEASIQAGAALQITADQIHNEAGGQIQGDTIFLRAIAEHALINRGLIDARDTRIDSATIKNLGTGRLYGDQVALRANNLLNGGENDAAPVIAARSRLDIGAVEIRNEDHALLASAGDLAIGGALDPNGRARGQARVLHNRSATIDARGSLTVAAAQIDNINKDFRTEEVTLPAEHIIEYQGAGELNRYLPDQVAWRKKDRARYLVTPEGVFVDWLKYDFARVVKATRVAQTDPARVLSGGDMTIEGQSVLNDHSHILAGGALHARLDSLTNTEAPGQRVSTDTGSATFARRDTYCAIKALVACLDREYETVSRTTSYQPPPTVVELALSPTRYEQQTASPSSDKLAGVRVATVPVNAMLADSSLFRRSPNPGSGHLIETDPAFTQYRQWLSSDTLLRQLAIDPARTAKRLGDGWLEQQLLREQVAQLTGRRFLDGYSSDDAQYEALMNQTATFARAHQLRPGIALTAAQMAVLTSDIVWLVAQEISLPDGERTTVLVPQLYVRLKDGDLQSGGALIAGGDVHLQVSGELRNSGSIAGRQILALEADQLRNLGGRLIATDVGIAARTDLDNLGGSIAARHSLTAIAGRDLTVAATASTQTNAQGSRTQVNRMATLTVSGGTLTVAAGRDLRLAGAGIVNVPALPAPPTQPAYAGEPAKPAESDAGGTMLSAGRDIVLGTVTERSDSHLLWNTSNQRHDISEVEVGSVLQTEGQLQLQAGHDVRATAASLTSAQGAITATAGHELTVGSAQATRQVDESHRNRSRSGPFATQTTTTRDRVKESIVQGSSISGDTVTLVAGGDMRLHGSQAVSTAGTMLSAAGDISLDAATNSREDSHYRKQKRSGLMGSGGVGVTIGTRTQSVDHQSSHTTSAGSTAGSVQGDVQIQARTNYRQSGSDVLAPRGDIAICAQRIAIDEARNIVHSTTTSQFKQTGVTLALSSPVLSAVQTAQQMVESAGQTKDTRMQALAVANTAMAAANAYEAVQAGQSQTINGKDNQIRTGTDEAGNATSRDANAADQIGGVTLGVSLGSSRSNSTTVTHSDTAAISTVAARGDVQLVATGAGTRSDLTLQGATVSGQSVTLFSDDALTLRAAGNTASQHSKNTSHSASVGLAISSAGGIGATASASYGRGRADGSDVSHTVTHLTADQIMLVSVGDASIKGAVVKADQIIAAVQGYLVITSLQDTSTFDSRQHNVGGGVMVGSGVTGNANFSRSTIGSDYASVTEQSGLRAGDGGFALTVAGDTTLTGGAITSTDAAVSHHRNRFDTGGTLSTSDIANQASYTARSTSINVGTGMSSVGKLVPAGTAAGIGNDSDSDASITHAAISGIAGNRDARTGDQEAGITPIFDAQRVSKEINAQVQITQAFSQQASTAVRTYMQEQRQALRARVSPAATEQERQDVQAQLRDINKQERVLNVLIGAVTGTAAAAVSKEVLSAAAEEMRQLMIEDSKKFAGVSNGNAPPLSNVSASSTGVRGDGVKVGGVRVDLDVVCGKTDERCERNPDGSLKIDKQGLIQFNPAAAGMPLEGFLKTPEAKKMVGPTGGIQGAKGSLFGIPYESGSWQDKLIEAFSGTHDMIGGKLSGLYDEQGNIKRGISKRTSTAYDAWTAVAIVPAVPFAAAELLSPEIWNGIAIFLKEAK